MKKSIVIAMIMLNQSSWAICENATDPNAIVQCFTSAYIEQESKMTDLQQASRKVLNKEDVRQMNRVAGLWQQYMVEQCELESRLFSEQTALRQAANAMCRYKKIKAQLQWLAGLLQQFSAKQSGANKNDS